MLTINQQHQVDLQISAHERQAKSEIINIDGTELIVDPLVANPAIMNSGVQIIHYLIENQDIVRGKIVIDMGTGSGVIGIFAAKLGARKVYLIDIDPEAVKNARKNIAKHHLGDRCITVNSDLFRSFNHQILSDIQIFNHPYFATEPIKGKEWTRIMLGGTALIEEYFKQAPKYSKRNALYILSWLSIAENINLLDNNPKKRAVPIGYKVLEEIKQNPVKTGLQQAPFKIYVFQRGMDENRVDSIE